MALSFLTESSRAPIGDLRFDQWPYVANGLLVILLFWSRSIPHTLTLIRWPLEFAHNFLYITCTLIEAITFTDLTDPIRWYALTATFGRRYGYYSAPICVLFASGKPRRLDLQKRSCTPLFTAIKYEHF